jgi:hypothetical protein
MMLKNAYSQSYRKMSELSSPPITLAVLDPGNKTQKGFRYTALRVFLDVQASLLSLSLSLSLSISISLSVGRDCTKNQF